MEENKLVIDSENKAWEIFAKSLKNEIGDDIQIEFSNWPTFELKIKGKDFYGTVPTRIMPPILELQKEIHRLYCQLKYDSKNLAKLTDQDRELLELIVKVEEGSSNYVAELWEALNTAIKESNMSGRQVLILLLGVSFMITSSVAWKDWLITKEKQHDQQATLQLSQEETQRTQLIIDGMKQSNQLKEAKQSIDSIRDSAARKLKPSDQLFVSKSEIVNGARATEVVPPPKEEPKEIRIDGEFIIKEIKFSDKKTKSHRMVVTRVLDQKTYTVDIPFTYLNYEQKKLIAGGFDGQRVLLELNAREYRGTIRSASLVTIKEIPPATPSS